MEYLEKLNSFLNKILLILGSVAVLLLMSVATVNVVLRYPFKMPWRGAIHRKEKTTSLSIF